MPTYFISDKLMLQHKCEWDETHIEKPLRLSSILNILESSGLIKQCEVLEPKQCSVEDLELIHSRSYIDEIRRVSLEMDVDQQEEYCKQNEDIYINAYSWESALYSAGCAIEALQHVLNKPGSNAFAAIRPPGHHASYNTPCGFCLFNNVAICAKMARSKGLERVLIIDWDIHVINFLIELI